MTEERNCDTDTRLLSKARPGFSSSSNLHSSQLLVSWKAPHNFILQSEWQHGEGPVCSWKWCELTVIGRDTSFTEKLLLILKSSYNKKKKRSWQYSTWDMKQCQQLPPLCRVFSNIRITRTFQPWSWQVSALSLPDLSVISCFCVIVIHAFEKTTLFLNVFMLNYLFLWFSHTHAHRFDSKHFLLFTSLCFASSLLFFPV